jgi:hypothetical protein
MEVQRDKMEAQALFNGFSRGTVLASLRRP